MTRRCVGLCLWSRTKPCLAENSTFNLYMSFIGGYCRQAGIILPPTFRSSWCIIFEQALVCAHASPQRYNEIEAATRSILFLATPHRGSKSANIGSLLANVAALAFQRPPMQLLNTLKHESDVLSRLSEEFRAIHHPFDIINFYERRTSILNSLVCKMGLLGVYPLMILRLLTTRLPSWES